MSVRERLNQFVKRADVADLVGVAVFAGLPLLLIFGVIVPVAMHDRLAFARHGETVRIQQRANALNAGLRTASNELDRIKAGIAAAPDRLRPASALNERLAALVTLAADCGVGIKDLKPGDGVRTAKHVAVPLRVAGRGSYPDVSRLLHRLHDVMPDMTVEGFGLTAGGAYTLDLQWLAALPDAAGAVAVTP